MYKVIGMPMSRASRIIWMLEELQLDYDIEPALPGSESALAHNASGKIPILLDDEGALVDSVAICQYLADKSGRFTYPAGTRERAIQDSFTQFAADDLETPLWTAAKHSFVLPKEQRVKEVKPSCKWEFAHSLEALEQRLGAGPYLMGDEFTVADLMVTNCILWSAAAKFDAPSAKIQAYVDGVTARPAHQRAIARGAF